MSQLSQSICMPMICHSSFALSTSLVAQTVKHLPTMQETRVQSLGREDFLEKEMTTHSSIPTWRIPWKAWSNSWSHKDMLTYLEHD